MLEVDRPSHSHPRDSGSHVCHSRPRRSCSKRGDRCDTAHPTLRGKGPPYRLRHADPLAHTSGRDQAAHHPLRGDDLVQVGVAHWHCRTLLLCAQCLSMLLAHLSVHFFRFLPCRATLRIALFMQLTRSTEYHGLEKDWLRIVLII